MKYEIFSKMSVHFIVVIFSEKSFHICSYYEDLNSWIHDLLVNF